MIRSMKRSMISTMIKSMINPDNGEATRYFAQLDEVLMSHFAYANPIVFGGDFDIKIKIYIEDVSSIVTAIMIFGTAANTNNSMWITPTGQVTIRDNAGVTVSSPAQPITNNKLHQIHYIKTAGNLQGFVDDVEVQPSVAFGGYEIGLIGVRQNSLFPFNGIISDSVLTDKSNPANWVTTTNLLSLESANVEQSLEGNNSVTYINIPEDNRELFRLSDNKTQWDNINPSPQDLPPVIEIA